eukprot:4696825-Prymnesium_polylepis.1
MTREKGWHHPTVSWLIKLVHWVRSKSSQVKSSQVKSKEQAVCVQAGWSLVREQCIPRARGAAEPRTARVPYYSGRVGALRGRHRATTR